MKYFVFSMLVYFYCLFTLSEINDYAFWIGWAILTIHQLKMFECANEARKFEIKE